MNEWIKFLHDVVAVDQAPAQQQEAIDCLQMSAGYSLTGYTSEEVFFYLWGPPRSGKGTYVETVQAFMPYPMSTTVDFTTFELKREGDAQNFALAPLKPCRTVFASESHRHAQIDVAKIKNLTGGDTISCAFKHKNFFTYKPQWKIWLVSNWPLNMDVDDDAAWIRPIVFSFPQSHVGAVDKKLKARLRSPKNLKHAFDWAVEGAHRWYESPNGLVIPTTVQDTAKAHRDELDYIQQWIGECCETNPKRHDLYQSLFNSYVSWCKDNGVDSRKKKSFSQGLQRKGFEPNLMTFPTGQARGYKGIQLNAQAQRRLDSLTSQVISDLDQGG